MSNPSPADNHIYRKWPQFRQCPPQFAFHRPPESSPLMWTQESAILEIFQTTHHLYRTGTRPFPTYPHFAFTTVPVKRNLARVHAHVSPNADSSSSEYIEPGTNVKFQSSLNLPGCSTSLCFLGVGYREKVFAIIVVKVYAAGLYSNPTIFSKLSEWRGRSSEELQQDSLFFDAIYHVSLEKSLHIILVRDVDGKAFWDALDEAISPRIKSPSPVDDASALSLFRSIFQGKPLKKGPSLFLTWLDPTKIRVCVSSGVCLLQLILQLNRQMLHLLSLTCFLEVIQCLHH